MVLVERGIQITMEMCEKEMYECRQGCHYYFFVHYFHNDYHYAEALIEFCFVSRVCGERNNYHLSDIKIHAEHFHTSIELSYKKKEKNNR